MRIAIPFQRYLTVLSSLLPSLSILRPLPEPAEPTKPVRSAAEEANVRLRVFPRVAAALLFFTGFEALVFHTDLYPSMIEPDSTTGSVELRVRTELRRPKLDHNQVLALGNSRMGLLPRVVNQMNPGTGYTYGTIAAPGTYIRCWYYLLRAVDPAARGYAAIVIPSDDYDELDQRESLDARPWDLHYVLARLELGDLLEFAGSYRDNHQKWIAARGIILKSFVYKRDFQELLLNPQKRLTDVRTANQHWAQWAYDYTGPGNSLAGLEVDWQRKTARYPARFTADERRLVESTLFAARPPDAGRDTAYYRYWYSRILHHYRDSATKIIVFRLPRGPVSPPPHSPKLDSAVRQLASQRNVVVLEEHLFDQLERPEFFRDPIHLNREGMERLSRMLAIEIRKILGPPRA